MHDVKEEFERCWIVAFKAYQPLLRTEGPQLVHLVSAVKGLAWNCYLQGRTDEMGRALAQERRLTRTKISTLLNRSQSHATHHD